MPFLSYQGLARASIYSRVSIGVAVVATLVGVGVQAPRAAAEAVAPTIFRNARRDSLDIFYSSVFIAFCIFPSVLPGPGCAPPSPATIPPYLRQRPGGILIQKLFQLTESLQEIHKQFTKLFPKVCLEQIGAVDSTGKDLDLLGIWQKLVHGGYHLY